MLLICVMMKVILNQSNAYPLTRFCFQRALAFIYFLGFCIVVNQFIPLLGENGLLPAKDLIRYASFWEAPSFFHGLHSDTFFLVMGWVGLILSLVALTGLSECLGVWFSAFVWALLWFTYMSFVNVGRAFYGFGWESILLETGFLAIFLGSKKSSAPVIVMWMLRWVLFRVMFGAGLIKLRGDKCWLDLTCMVYHYETQPVPNPLSWYFHHLPLWFHKIEILFTHFVELIVPWGYLMTRRIRIVAGLLTVLFQLILILSGNLSWLNYMTIVLCIPCFDDRFFLKRLPVKLPEVNSMSLFRKFVLGTLTALILFLSINPTLNMISPGQKMNAGFDPLHLVNTYGAFGSVTKKRREIVLEGTSDSNLSPATEWKEYEFKCKPGDVSRMPCLMSPYHYRLDWHIWFAAMNTYHRHSWILKLSQGLLQNDKAAVGLIAYNPFIEDPPKFIRAVLYDYRFTTPEEKHKTGDWWVRKKLGGYFPPIALKDKA